jgi:hypothetical protein
LIVSATPLPDHREVRHVDVRAWLPGAVHTVYLLSR